MQTYVFLPALFSVFSATWCHVVTTGGVHSANHPGQLTPIVLQRGNNVNQPGLQSPNIFKPLSNVNQPAMPFPNAFNPSNNNNFNPPDVQFPNSVNSFNNANQPGLQYPTPGVQFPNAVNTMFNPPGQWGSVAQAPNLSPQQNSPAEGAWRGNAGIPGRNPFGQTVQQMMPWLNNLDGSNQACGPSTRQPLAHLALLPDGPDTACECISSACDGGTTDNSLTARQQCSRNREPSVCCCMGGQSRIVAPGMNPGFSWSTRQQDLNQIRTGLQRGAPGMSQGMHVPLGFPGGAQAARVAQADAPIPTNNQGGGRVIPDTTWGTQTGPGIRVVPGIQTGGQGGVWVSQGMQGRAQLPPGMPGIMQVVPGLRGGVPVAPGIPGGMQPGMPIAAGLQSGMPIALGLPGGIPLPAGGEVEAGTDVPGGDVRVGQGIPVDTSGLQWFPGQWPYSEVNNFGTSFNLGVRNPWAWPSRK